MFIDKIKNQKGFSLVEAIVFSLIVVIVITTFYKTFVSGTKVLRDARAKIAAAQVANEQLETLRNVPYESLNSTKIVNDKTEPKSGIEFRVITDIKYVNDIFDNGDGDTLKPNDYKIVRVDVIWKSSGQDKKISVNTIIAPPGTEELFTGGILDIHIAQSNGASVQGAEVQVYDLDVSAVNPKNTHFTSSDGRVYLMGYNARDCRYKITVRKVGYYDVDTMPCYSGIAGTYYPVDVHASVVQGGMWPKSITFDPLSSLQLKTKDPLGNSIGNIDFNLEGGRNLGGKDGIFYYSFEKSAHNTDGSGDYALANVSAGEYFFEYGVTANNSNYKLWKLDPLSAFTNNQFSLLPGVVNNIKAILIPNNIPSLFINVLDDVDSTALLDVSVRVQGPNGYDQEALTDQFGYVYFPKDSVTPMISGQYNISVSATGYQSKTVENVDVTNLKEEIIRLNPTT